VAAAWDFFGMGSERETDSEPCLPWHERMAS